MDLNDLFDLMNRSSKKTEVHIHLEPNKNIEPKLDSLILSLQSVNEKLEVIMAQNDQMLADLKEANATTDEIASDVEVLLSKLVAGGLTKEETVAVQAEVTALTNKLKGVAAKYTPEVTLPLPG